MTIQIDRLFRPVFAGDMLCLTEEGHFSGFEYTLCPLHIIKMESLKRNFMVTRMPLVLGFLISVDKFHRLCSPRPVLASEWSFQLPHFRAA